MLPIVWFNWDKKNSSNKFNIVDADDCSDSYLSEDSSSEESEVKTGLYGHGRVATTAKVIDGSGFKTAIGDRCMRKGGKYFFQV
jgi:hypothetical protein